MDYQTSTPIWALNLPRDIDRRIYMTNQLNELGVEFQIIEGVDGKLLTDLDLKYYSKEMALIETGRALSAGEIGCAFAHIKLWRKIVDESHPEVLIFEDDIKIGKSIFQILNNRDKLPQDYEHINFATNASRLPFGEFLTDIYRASNFDGAAYSTCAYLLTYKGAKKLLDNVFPISMPNDHYFYRKAGLISYGIYPRVVVFANFESTIKHTGEVPKRGFLLTKYLEFKNIFRALAIFFGFKQKTLTELNHKLSNIYAKLRHLK